jgi:hypothetical protein
VALIRFGACLADVLPGALTHPRPMTYCIGIRLNAGLVFLSDSRTNAGIDQISTFRKMIVYEKPATASWRCCRRAT